jgi:hypothetical protein
MRYQFHKSEGTIAKRLWVKVLTNKCDGKPERARARIEARTGSH